MKTSKIRKQKASTYFPNTFSSQRKGHFFQPHSENRNSFFNPLPIQGKMQRSENVRYSLTSSQYKNNPRLQAAYNNAPPIKFGEQGEAVRLIQNGLLDDGFFLPNSTGTDGELDGVFGNETFNAVKIFQKKHELLIDGIVGLQTMGKLDELATFSQIFPQCLESEELQHEILSALHSKTLNQEQVNSFNLPYLCKLRSPKKMAKIKIKPQNPSKPIDLKRYKCSSNRELKVHIYFHPSNWGIARKQFLKSQEILKAYNITMNVTGMEDIPNKEIYNLSDFCDLAKTTFKNTPPKSGSLPIFVLGVTNRNGKSHNGTTWSRSHCSSVQVELPSGIEKVIVVDVKTPDDTTMVHEIGHVAGNNHASALDDTENIMYVSSKKLNRRFLWHDQLRKFCNVKF